MPYLTNDLPGIGGVIKTIPEDFFVDETLPFEPSGAGSHTYIKIEKRGMTTFEAINRVASVLQINSDSIGFAGMKDATAVTRQFLSVPVEPAKLSNLGIPGLQTLSAVPHGHKLRRGLVKCNSFNILIRKVPDDSLNRAREILSVLVSRGVPNFYGPQRFGIDRKNIEIGKSLVAGEHPRFKKRLSRLVISSYQAHLFNQVLERRLPEFDRLWSGDLALHHGRYFLVNEVTEELRLRLAQFDISPSGPIFGYRMPEAGGKEAELEREVLETEGLNLESFKVGPSLRFRGSRRPFRVPLSGLEVSQEENSLRVKFTLPSGSYATTVLAELMK